jgi:uncharacterized membrane protein
MLVILANSFILTLDKYPISEELSDTYDNMNGVFAIFFIVDMIIKMTSLGIKNYFTKDAMNSFDFVVVVISTVDLAMNPPKWFIISDVGAIADFGIISLLRCFRLFRILKFALQFSSVKKLLHKIIMCFYDLGSFMVLFGLFILINALLGMQFYSNRFRFDENGNWIEDINSDAWRNAFEKSRSNFDDFSSAVASVFQIITTESWTSILFR